MPRPALLSVRSSNSRMFVGGGIAVVAIAGTAAVMVVYQSYDQHQETERLLELGKYFTEPSTIDAMMKNNPAY